MDKLSLAALVLAILEVVVIIPIFFLVKGTETEIPFSMLVISVAVVGMISAQYSLLRKGEVLRASALPVPILVQSLVLTAIAFYLFIGLTAQNNLWFPIVTGTIAAILAILAGVQIRFSKKEFEKVANCANQVKVE